MPIVADLPDEQLVELLQKDDKEAFSEIYHRYASSLADFCGPRLHQIEDAHDVLQDLFVKLWENRRTLAVTISLRSYLFSALRYRIIDKIRHNATRESYAEMVRPLLALAQTDNPYEQLNAKDIQQQIELQLKKLPPKTQQIYKLSREKQYSIREIADQLQLSEQTVKNQLSIALKHLRELASILLLVQWLNN